MLFKFLLTQQRKRIISMKNPKTRGLIINIILKPLKKRGNIAFVAKFQ